jgi:hypothetical protein
MRSDKRILRINLKKRRLSLFSCLPAGNEFFWGPKKRKIHLMGSKHFFFFKYVEMGIEISVISKWGNLPL